MESFSNMNQALDTLAPSKCILLSIPTEIQLYIFKLACTHDVVIRPEEWPNENGFGASFVHGLQYVELDRVTRLDPNLARELAMPGAYTAEDLAATCKHIRSLVLGSEQLFYKSNIFEFGDMYDMHRYLVALTPSRMNAVRSIYLFTEQNDDFTAYWPQITLLACCDGLENLTLDITHSRERFWTDEKDIEEFVTDFNSGSIMRLRGLKSFNITYDDDPVNGFIPSYFKEVHGKKKWKFKAEISLRFNIATIEQRIKEIVTQGTKEDCELEQEVIDDSFAGYQEPPAPMREDLLLLPEESSLTVYRPTYHISAMGAEDWAKCVEEYKSTFRK